VERSAVDALELEMLLFQNQSFLALYFNKYLLRFARCYSNQYGGGGILINYLKTVTVEKCVVLKFYFIYLFEL
jgi:hypothetical protein